MNNTATSMKHPRGLYTLFFTEMWERFSYYGMRALLVLYLTNEAMKGGFGLERANALEIYALFTGLVYLTPILGGLLADKLWGQRKTIYIGGLLMALGQFALAASVSYGDANVSEMREFMLNLGLGLLIMGNGFFKPNISTIVGALYESNDPRKDSAFTIFYMGINLGAFLSPLICGTLGEKIGWQYGFASAGLGMLLGLVWFFSQAKTLGHAGFPPGREGDDARLNTRDYLEVLLYTGLNIALVIGFLLGWNKISEGSQSLLINVITVAAIVGLGYTIFTGTSGKNEWSKVSVIFILCFFNIFFWAGFEQAGGTFNLFAAENTNRMLFDWEIPASYFQSINAIAIFGFAPVFSFLWMRLSQVGKNPNTPVKFALGLLLLGLGFVVMSMANSAAAGGVLVSPLWLVAVYLIHTFGELCLSPIGLSMVTKLAPQKIVSVMMGLWFASTALANYMAGVLENLLHTYMPEMQLFNFLVLTSISSGVLLLILSPYLKKMMHDIS
ncbi:MAG: peptide MFS transporter [Bacteroidota bacterium]|nr:peptide MFS transporter [Bacteroidota bacterium]MDX5429408.1 peptide MFS transporter [Bacteroidota bacterium]MDX5468199.1 peptide MFS transporter [Bacteroidota bacterium]